MLIDRTVPPTARPLPFARIGNAAGRVLNIAFQLELLMEAQNEVCRSA